MDLKPIAEFAIKHATAPENLIKWVSDGNCLNWEVKNAFCVPRDNALVFATQAELDAFIRWLRTGDRDENVKELAAALREAYACKNGEHRKHFEVIKLLAADWYSGIDLLRLKLDIAEGREKEDKGSKDGTYGCYDDDFKSGNFNSFFRALDYYRARGFSDKKQHAMVYRDMLAVMETTMQLTGKRVTGVIMDDIVAPAEQPNPRIITKPEDERVSWMFYTNQLKAQQFIVARKNGASFSWSKTGNFEPCLKLNGMDADDFGAWWADWIKRYARGHTAHIAFGHWLEAECKRFSNMPKYERLKLQAKYADLDTRCMEDEPGPEDARFGKHDDQADALRDWRDVLNPPKHIDDTPARVETVYYNPPGNHTPTSEGTIPMSTTSLSFTTVNYVSINGGAPIDLSKLPADNIFSLIEQTEAEIKRLNEISNKPKALVKRIDDLQAGIDRLVAEIDGRDA